MLTQEFGMGKLRNLISGRAKMIFLFVESICVWKFYGIIYFFGVVDRIFGKYWHRVC